MTLVHKIGNGHHFYKSNYSCISIIMYYNIMCSTLHNKCLVHIMYLFYTSSIQITETDKSQLVIKQQVGFLRPARMFFKKLSTNFIHTNICLIVHVNES